MTTKWTHSITYWLLLTLAPLPAVYFLLHYSSTISRLAALDEQMELIHTRQRQAETLSKREHTLLNSLSQSDPRYIDKHLETLTFLEPEIKKMETFLSDAHVDEAIHKRLHFLKESNRLLFVEDKIRSAQKMQEVYERQQQPVEMDEEDLKKLLALVEGITIWPYGPKEGRPQLIVQDFSLSKKREHAQHNVFIVTMNVIKREKP